MAGVGGMTEQYRRPDPDQLLKHVEAEDKNRRRGRLKIFLGYAAGVGKTYAMLEAAHQRRAEGVDVVVGCVETHGRAETEVLLADLEVMSRRLVEYRGITLTEMDSDALLARRPQLVLVDELAHTNAPGGRHTKRFLDVEELLAAGIDVYSTLNIQHLESLNDVVAQITGVRVLEKVPDSVIDQATEIELIDLPPGELQQRLRDGKVYVPEQAAHAVHKFFRTGNLTALRELSMRRAAERVDHQMLAYMQTRAIPGPWPAGERLLVAVSPSTLGERLVRTARRLADELHATWFVVSVQTPDDSALSPERQERLARILHLAEELGATALSLSGASVAAALTEFARAHNVTKIIVGKPLRARWLDVVRGSVVDQIIRGSGNIDVYIISAEAEPMALPGYTLRQPYRPGWRYLYSLLLVVLATLACEALRSWVAPENLVMVYLLAVVIAAVYWGRGPAVVASVLGVLVFDFFLVPPRLTFAVSDSQYLLTFLGLFVVGVVISHLTARVRNQAEAAQERQSETATLYEMSRQLAGAVEQPEVLQIIVREISQTFGREALVLLPTPASHDVLSVAAYSNSFVPDGHELAVATWAFRHGETAGRGTSTLSAASARYLPLKTSAGVVGVLGVKPLDPASHLTPEQHRLLDACASVAALAIERARLVEMARSTQLLEATEKLQMALLNSVSHDLRTPLVTITGALSSLADRTAPLDDPTRTSLIETAWEEAERLNRLVGNLLDMTRLEAGALRIRSEPCDIQDVVGSVLERLKSRLAGRQVNVNIAPDLPWATMDFVLMEQVLVNLVENAVKYSPPDAAIDIGARLNGAQLEVEVADRGVGIPVADLARVFDKFYRIQNPDSVVGTGLGLAICKGIVEAHGGSIRADNRPGGGTLLTVSLPVDAQGATQNGVDG